MKKFLALFMVVVLVLGGCGSTAKGEVATEITEPVTIELWHPFSGDVEAELQSLTDTFNEENNMITVNLVAQGVYGDLYTKLISAQGSNSLPTMSFAYGSWRDLVPSVEVLTPYQDIEGYTMDFTNIVPAFLEEMTGAEGDVYGLPYNKSGEVIFYNKDLIKEAGIDTAPTSLDELFEDAKTITDKTGVTGIGFDVLGNFLTTSMMDNGVAWVDEATGTFNFDNEAVEADIQMYKDAIDAGYARTLGEDDYMSNVFGSGNVAMYVGSNAGVSYVESAVDDKFEWGAIASATSTVAQQGTNIIIYNTATPEEKLAAWEYMTYLYSDDNLVDFALATGYIPPTTSAINSDAYTEAAATNEVIAATTDEIDKLKVAVPSFAGANEIYNNNIKLAMSKILDNGEDIDTTLKTLNEEAEAIYSRNN